MSLVSGERQKVRGEAASVYVVITFRCPAFAYIQRGLVQTGPRTTVLSSPIGTAVPVQSLGCYQQSSPSPSPSLFFKVKRLDRTGP